MVSILERNYALVGQDGIWCILKIMGKNKIHNIDNW